MAWMYLVLAGFLEIGWPIGLKLGWTEEGVRVLWLAFAIACILCSGLFLLMAQQEKAMTKCASNSPPPPWLRR